MKRIVRKTFMSIILGASINISYAQSAETVLKSIERGVKNWEKSAPYTEFRALISFNLAANYSRIDHTDSFYYFLIDYFNNEPNTDNIPSVLGDYHFLKYHKQDKWMKIDSFYSNIFYNKFKAQNSKYAYTIMRMAGMDQGVRYYYVHNPMKTGHEIMEVDTANLSMLKRLIKEEGFPIVSRVGETASDKSFLLIQHSDKDLEFQKQCLDSVEHYMKIGEYSKKNYAYLKDRIMLRESGQQLYGTQISDLKKKKFFPIADSANVNKRREKMGLNTLEEYLNSITSF